MVMKKFLFGTGLVVELSTFILWAMGGFNTGWSRSKTATEKIDEITGISYPVYEEGFVAGIDTLAIGIAVGTALIIVSFFVKSKNK